MKKIISIIVLLWCSACSSLSNLSIDLMAGRKISSNDFIGRNPSGSLRVYWNKSKNTRIGYEHISHFVDGKPFNDRQEDTIDQFFYSKLFGKVSSYTPTIEWILGYKYKTDGFEGNRSTMGIKVQQPLYISSTNKAFCEYSYIKSSIDIQKRVDDLKRVSCGITINNQ
jgi:hypothetical protein